MRAGSLRSKVSVSICLLIVVSVFVYFGQVPAGHSWGGNGHRFIENNAEHVFSTNSFFSNNHNTLYTWSTMPDSGWMPGTWHYLDGHSYDPLVYSGGYLPWAIENVFENLVLDLEGGNMIAATQLFGAICHYAGDSTQPLHSTWNYDPNGKHSAYETTALNANIGTISIPDNYLPQALDNVLGAAFASLAKSFSYTAEGANPGDNNLTAFLDNNITWNAWIKSMTENRLRSAVQFTANLWYTAMIQAGFIIQAPTLTSPSGGSSTNDNTPTFVWTSVSGTSSYDFQLASDNNFTINARTVKGLATTSYTPVTPLTNGGWYWHVRTGDNSADVGLWSQTQSFTVSSSTSTRGVSVSISPSENHADNGQTVTFTVTVNNTGNITDNYNLTINDSAGWGPTLDNNSFANVLAGENRTTTLRVSIPGNALPGNFDYITVTAISQGDSSVRDNDTCIARSGNALTVDLVEGWNLVGFAGAGASDTPNSLFTGLTYSTDYLIYYWNAPGGPYALQGADKALNDNFGYWIWVDQNKTVITSGAPPASSNVHLVAGWNIVSFPVVNENTTPANVFTGLTYLTDYTISYWNAPGGPYGLQAQTTAFKDNIGYWVWIDTDKTVTVP